MLPPPANLDTSQLVRGLEHATGILRREHHWCLTHGEPNGSNLVQDTAGAPYLVDWNSARIAPPERHLWLLDHQPESLQTYVELTSGTVPDSDVLRMYRLWWNLSETAVYTLQFRAAHVEHGPLLVHAVIGRRPSDAWSRSAIRPCDASGFPPDVHSSQEATGRYLLPDTALHPRASTRVKGSDAHQEEEDLDDW